MAAIRPWPYGVTRSGKSVQRQLGGYQRTTITMSSGKYTDIRQPRLMSAPCGLRVGGMPLPVAVEPCHRTVSIEQRPASPCKQTTFAGQPQDTAVEK